MCIRDRPLPDLVARLSDQLGDAALFRAVLADRWRPEGAWSPAPFPPPTLVDASPDPVRKALASDDPVEIQAAWEVAAPFRRPAVLLPKRLPVAVVCEQMIPTRMELDGVWLPVRHAEGPERLFGEWWEDDGGFDRAYWSLTIDGGREAWIVCEHDRWSLHGWFD